jgi:hypothetical protein
METYVAAGSPQAGAAATEQVLVGWLAAGVPTPYMEQEGWLV